jgi:hypothetical protein
MDLTAYLERQRKAKLVAAIKEAARIIAECQDEQKRWRCMHELRKLQARLNYPTL